MRVGVCVRVCSISILRGDLMAKGKDKGKGNKGGGKDTTTAKPTKKK